MCLYFLKKYACIVDVDLNNFYWLETCFFKSLETRDIVSVWIGLSAEEAQRTAQRLPEAWSKAWKMSRHSTGKKKKGLPGKGKER